MDLGNTHDAKPLGRPKYVDSVKAAASALGYPEQVVQYLKDQGLDAWQGSRCYLDKLEDYIDENGLPDLPESELDRWNLEVVKERARKLKLANDIDEGKSIPRDQVVAFVMELAFRFKTVLKKGLEDELPLELAGKPADEIRRIAKGWVNEICARMQKDVEVWTR